jgi:hypothetical protein
MAYETDEERELRQQAERLAEVVDHKNHLESPFLEAPRRYSDAVTVARFNSPEIPASPASQDIVDALVSLGFVTQAET